MPQGHRRPGGRAGGRHEEHKSNTRGTQESASLSPGLHLACPWLAGGFGVAWRSQLPTKRSALPGPCPGNILRLPAGMLNRKLGHSWQDLLCARNNTPRSESFHPQCSNLYRLWLPLGRTAVLRASGECSRPRPTRSGEPRWPFFMTLAMESPRLQPMPPGELLHTRPTGPIGPNPFDLLGGGAGWLLTYIMFHSLSRLLSG